MAAWIRHDASPVTNMDSGAAAASGAAPQPAAVCAAAPRLSIITPNLNHGAFLDDAIRSAGMPDGAVPGDSGIEHVVVDGGSTDRSHAVVARWPSVRLEVRPDLDSHAAMNHGLTLARGEFIGFLNADDRYEPGILPRVLAAFDAAPGAEAVCGGVRFFRDNGRCGPDGEVELARRGHLDGPAALLELTFGAPGFNSWFFRTAALRALGGLRTEWRIAADRDLLMRLAARGRPARVDGVAYHYRVHDGSRTLNFDKSNRSAWAREHIRLARLHRAAWAGLPGGPQMLRDWRALEGLKLLAGVLRGEGRPSDLADLAVTPWWRLGAALRRRREWLKEAGG